MTDAILDTTGARHVMRSNESTTSSGSDPPNTRSGEADDKVQVQQRHGINMLMYSIYVQRWSNNLACGERASVGIIHIG